MGQAFSVEISETKGGFSGCSSPLEFIIFNLCHGMYSNTTKAAAAHNNESSHDYKILFRVSSAKCFLLKKGIIS